MANDRKVHSFYYGYVARDPYEHKRNFKASMKLNFQLEAPPNETIGKHLENDFIPKKRRPK